MKGVWRGDMSKNGLYGFIDFLRIAVLCDVARENVCRDAHGHIRLHLQFTTCSPKIHNCRLSDFTRAQTHASENITS